MIDNKMLQMISDRVVALDSTIKTGFKDVNKKIEENGNKLDKLILQLDKLVKQRIKNRRIRELRRKKR